MRTHTYFIAFWNHTYIENASVTLTHEIKNYNDVLEVENLLNKRFGYTALPVLIFWHEIEP